MGQQSLEHGPAIIGSCTVACQHVRPFSLGSWIFNLVKELYYSHIAARNQLNCRGSNPRLRMKHHEGMVSLTPDILFSTANCHF